MSSAVATYNASPRLAPVAEFSITNEQIALIKQTIMRGATDLELDMFLNLCRAKRLDPLTRQIYGIKTNQGVQMFASIDGLRVIAQRSGEYAGQSGPYWCGSDGQWVDVWLQDGAPAAAKVGIWRRGFAEPTWGVATWRSYGANKSGPVWKSMPDVMLAKAAEAQALRKAFPDDLSGLYVREEFTDDEQPIRQGNVADRHGAIPSVALRDARASVALDGETMSLSEGQAVNTETGEITTKTTPELNADIKSMREYLGWSPSDVLHEAEKLGHNLKTRDGLLAMHAWLGDVVRHDQAGGMDAEAEDAIDAEYRATGFDGMPNGDRYAEIAPEAAT